MMLYGISLIGIDGYEEGREYFTTKKDRDERFGKVSVYKKEMFEIQLRHSTAWKLNIHGLARDKRRITDLEEKVKKLKQILQSNISEAIEKHL